MSILAVILCGILYRLDGWGQNDTLLPFWPFNKLKFGGVNYARYAIAPVVFACTHNPLHLLSYTIAVSIPYGEKHWWMWYGSVSWFGIGLILGLASLSWGVGLWMGAIVAVAKFYNLDEAIFETFVLGMGSTAWLLF